MKKLIVLAIALGCGCTSSRDDLPIVSWGNDQPPVTGPVAVGGGGTSAGTISGRVCLVTDPRELGGCQATGAGGLTVALGGARTTTAPDGSFSVPTPTGTNLAFTVSGPGVMTSSQPFSPNNTIPVVTQQLWDQVLGANGITLTAGTGSILASVVDRGGNPVTGATATSTPSPAFGPFFDGTTPTAWTLDGTGARGVVLFPGVTAGTAVLTFGDSSTGGETTVGGVQVVDGGITFVDSVLP